MYQGFRLNLGYRSKMIIFGSLLATFEVNNAFGGSWSSIENWQGSKMKTPNQVKFIEIYDTHG